MTFVYFHPLFSIDYKSSLSNLYTFYNSANTIIISYKIVSKMGMTALAELILQTYGFINVISFSHVNYLFVTLYFSS